MSLADTIEIIKNVLLDWRVIATVVTMLLFIAVANKIVTYRKRPKRKKGKKNSASTAPKPAPAPVEKTEDAEDEE